MKKYYTFMIDPELLATLKVAKEQTGFPEGLIIRQALKAWFESEGFTVKTKTARKRVAPRRRA